MTPSRTVIPCPFELIKFILPNEWWCAPARPAPRPAAGTARSHRGGFSAVGLVDWFRVPSTIEQLTGRHLVLAARLPILRADAACTARATCPDSPGEHLARPRGGGDSPFRGRRQRDGPYRGLRRRARLGQPAPWTSRSRPPGIAGWSPFPGAAVSFGLPSSTAWPPAPARRKTPRPWPRSVGRAQALPSSVYG